MSLDSLPLLIANGVAAADFGVESASSRYDLLLATTRAQAFADPAVHRLQVEVCTEDVPRRRALHRAGFRLEGIARQAAAGPDGKFLDVARYATLRSDQEGGADSFTAVMNTVTARKRVISHLLITDPSSRVCVLETTFKPDYELPGGILEVGESPRVGLVRELEEELNHTIGIGRLLVVDWLAPYLGWEDAVELIFDGGVLSGPNAGRLRPDLAEIRAIHWLAPDEAISAMAPFARGRLSAALDARTDGLTHYLEAGRRVS